jgi:hypothetical protein
VNELVGEDLPGCESSYETSIIMLEALLEPITSIESGQTEASADRLDEEDRLTIEKCISSICQLTIVIQSIRKRLDALRKKLDFASARNSPTPSLEKADRDRVRRLSSGSSGSVNAVRASDSPPTPSPPPSTTPTPTKPLTT